MKRKRKKFVVTIEQPIYCSISELRDYIEDAVSSYAGCYNPMSPIFGLNRDSVKVVRQRIHRRHRQ